MNVASAVAGGATVAEQAAGNSQVGEKEAFLKLLVAQISNQDPMAPQNSEQYVQQLTQFSTLEQLMTLNQGVEALGVGQLANNNQQALRFVGREVEANGDSVYLQEDGGATFGFKVDDPDVETVTVVVTDSNGREVRRDEGVRVTNGRRQTYTWDGTNDAGGRQVAGDYSVTVIAEKDGETVPVDTTIHGKVTGVRFDNGYPELMIGDRRIRMSDIVEVE